MDSVAFFIHAWSCRINVFRDTAHTHTRAHVVYGSNASLERWSRPSFSCGRITRLKGRRASLFSLSFHGGGGGGGDKSRALGPIRTRRRMILSDYRSSSVVLKSVWPAHGPAVMEAVFVVSLSLFAAGSLWDKGGMGIIDGRGLVSPTDRVK